MSDPKGDKSKLTDGSLRSGETSGDLLKSAEVASARLALADTIRKIQDSNINKHSGSAGGRDETTFGIQMDDGKTVSRVSPLVPKDILAQVPQRKQFESFGLPELVRSNELSLEEAHDKLTNLASAKIVQPAELAQFLTDLNHFEKEFKQRIYVDEDSRESEIIRTYEQISRLFEAEHDVLEKYPECRQNNGDTQWRVRVAEQIMHQAADPFCITQGSQALCLSESLQVRQYCREPASVAKLVADVLLTGAYKPFAGNELDLTKCPTNLIPDLFARQFTVVNEVNSVKPANRSYGPNGELPNGWILGFDNNDKKPDPTRTADTRSFASQLFDVTAVNLALADRGYRYEQPTPAEFKLAKVQARGRVVDIKHGKFVLFGNGTDEQKLSSTDISRIAYMITGKDERHFVITCGSLTPLESSSHLRKIYDLYNRANSVIEIFTPSEFKAALMQVVAQKQWPPIVRIDASTPPVNMTNGGSHFIVISNRSPDYQLLSFDNTWTEDSDHNGKPTIGLGVLAASMFTAKTAQSSVAHSYIADSQLYTSKPDKLERYYKLLLSMGNDLTSNGKSLKASQHPLASSDPTLKYWIKTRPEDVHLTIWKTTLLEWRAKYPPPISKTQLPGTK